MFLNDPRNNFKTLQKVQTPLSLIFEKTINFQKEDPLEV